MKRLYFIGIAIIVSTSIITEDFATLNQFFMLSDRNEEESSYPIPFNDLFLEYNLKIKINQLPLPIVNFSVVYSDIADNFSNNITLNFDYLISITSKSKTLIDVGINAENASFFENSSSRNFFLNSSEGQFIDRILTLTYDPGVNASNWTPFWILPDKIDINKSFYYPIYNFQMELIFISTLNTEDFPLFKEEHIIWIFQITQSENRSDMFLEHYITLIYDSTSGILIKGLLNTNLTQNNIKNSYLLDFELIATNGFSVFPTINQNSTSNDFMLPPPNYLFLLVIILSPIGVLILFLTRIRDIKGGLE